MEQLGSHFYIERAVCVEAEKLVPNPWNIQVTNADEQAAIAGSLNYFGQVEELLVRDHPDLPGFYQILSGEHRARELKGAVHVNIIYGLSEAEARQLSIVMNSTQGSTAEEDFVRLIEDITLLGLTVETAAATLPMSPAHLETLLQQAQSNTAPSKERQKKPSDDKWIALKVKVPISALSVIQQARAIVEEIRGGTLHENEDIAWGMVLEALAAELLAS